MKIDLTEENNAQVVNITKGTTQVNLDNAIAAAREARDTAETHKDSALSSASSATSSASTATAQATIATTKASEASSSATSASASATTATTKASEASTSATNASTSETNASTSETNAATYMNNALDYATDASLSETNAAGSATSASASATSASGSATTATTQAGIATTKASEASTSATNAASSATQASLSETSATGSATAASTSAANASVSETNAATSASSAGTSSTSAATSAASASTSATNASTSETNAATSASQASTSATSAATSATASATSATNAAISATSAATSETNAAASAASATAVITDATKFSALAPYSGYTQVSNKLDNFVFQESTSFLNKVADKNRYIKFGDKVVDTYGDELVTNGDFSDGLTGFGTNGTVTIENGRAKMIGYANLTVYFNAYANSIYEVTVNTDGNYRGIVSTASADKIFNENGETSGYYIYDSQQGIAKYYHIATQTGTRGFRLYSSNDVNAVTYIDNISVREIQTAQFQVPEVTEIITDGSNTTSVSVNAGDYVVDGSELVTNGTFDSDISGWTAGNGATLSVPSQTLLITGSGLNYPKAEQTINTVAGVKYVFSADCKVGTSASCGIQYSDGTNTITKVTTSTSFERLTLIVVGTGGLITFRLLDANTASSNTSYFDNISVKRVSDTFRCIQDAPIGTALTNTTYFEDRTEIGVTNQQLSYHAYNTVTNAYEGIKTETLFTDVSKEDLLDNSAWMSANGFSKVSKYLYSKNNYLCLPIGISQC